MSGSDTPTHNELSAMKVDELRKMCGELGLMVSGKKADLIDRILSQIPNDSSIQLFVRDEIEDIICEKYVSLNTKF